MNETGVKIVAYEAMVRVKAYVHKEEREA